MMGRQCKYFMRLWDAEGSVQYLEINYQNVVQKHTFIAANGAIYRDDYPLKHYILNPDWRDLTISEDKFYTVWNTLDGKV